MKKLLSLVCIAMLAVYTPFNAQTFTNSSDELPESFNSGGCVGVTDMNGDGFDDIVVLDQSLHVHIYYQNLDDTPGYTLKSFSSFGESGEYRQWGMAVADIDNDGHKDVFSGGDATRIAYFGGTSSGVFYTKITSPDAFELIELDVEEDFVGSDGLMFMQCANLADINNDGWIDAFGCDDDAESKIWINDGEGNLEIQNNAIDMRTTPVSDNSGNYGSTWTDFDNDNDLDLFIAKCRQFVDNPEDPRRINMAYMNDGANNYTDEAEDRGLILNEQSWSADFGDIDNDGDFDCLLTNHSTTLILMENDGKGHFKDITPGSGLEILGFFLQLKMVDFDNDGYLDVLTAGGDDDSFGEQRSQGLYRNNGDNTFTDMGITSKLPHDDLLHSFGLGDLNKDGYVDIYASYGSAYVSADFQNDDALWLNDGGDNTWIGFDLEGVESNRDAIGAKIQIYGDFGTQIREVRSGESYGISNSNIIHFGLGTYTDVEYAVIKWPSGNVQVLEDLSQGEYYAVDEESCDTQTVTVSADSELICEGSTTAISTTSTGTVLWSNGMIGSDVDAAGGNHSAVVLENGCASQSNVVCVVEESLLDVEITAQGSLIFCEGESVTLESTPAAGYQWNTDETSQSITVSESGNYFVEVNGEVCSQSVESNIIVVTVLDAPDSSPTSGTINSSPGMVELTATGDDLVWFDDADGTNIVGEGSPITLDVPDNTVFYVANQIVHGTAVAATGGKLTTSMPGQHLDNSNNGLVFSAFDDMVIKNVRVFSNGNAERTIWVEDVDGNEIVSDQFDIPDGESVVELDFFIPEGTGYRIYATTENDNPQLWRDSDGSGVSFPYDLGEVASITGTTIDGDNEFTFYYFFYDWNVESAPTVCYSELVPVSVIVGVEELKGIESFTIYPNPAATEIRYEYSTLSAGNLFVSLSDSQGKEVFVRQLDAQNGSHQGVIDLSNCAPGNYVLTLMENGKVSSQKIVIE